MISDHNDICQQTGFTANQDAETSAMAGWVDSSLLAGVREELTSNYGLELSFQEIEDLMEEHGISFGYEREYSVADLIFDSLQGEA